MFARKKVPKFRKRSAKYNTNQRAAASMFPCANRGTWSRSQVKHADFDRNVATLKRSKLRIVQLLLCIYVLVGITSGLNSTMLAST